MIRSKTPWLNRTSLIASSGISIEDLAIHPCRWITRSLVTTKCDVAHRTARRAGYQTKRRNRAISPPHTSTERPNPELGA
jgi:hypothetical protein